MIEVSVRITIKDSLTVNDYNIKVLSAKSVSVRGGIVGIFRVGEIINRSWASKIVWYEVLETD